MTLRACSTCNNGCGNGVAQTSRPDPVFRAMCAILCEVRTEACRGLLKPDPGKKNVQLSRIAEERARKSGALQSAIQRKYGAGALGKVAQQRMVPFAGKIANRAAASADAVKRYLAPIRDRIMREAAEAVGKKLAKKAATAWIKFVPVLNVLSTAYDIYDLASTGYDIYKMVDEQLGKFKGNVYESFPDLAIEGPDGKLKDIYDFKFDGDRYRNDQDKLYNEAMKQEGVQNPDVDKNGTVSPTTCDCDGAKSPIG